MLKTLLKLTASLFFAALIGGCVSHYGAATIVSEPSGAEVINTEDGSVIGVTPLTTVWKDSSSSRQYVALRLNKQGYESNVAHFWVSMRHKSEKNAQKSAEDIEVVLTKK